MRDLTRYPDPARPPPAANPFVATGDDTRVTPSVVTEAVAAVMRAASPSGSIDMALAAKIGGDIRPALAKALTGRIGSGAELIGLSTFHTILSQHLGSAAAGDVDADTRRAMQRTLETANRTGSNYAALIAGAGLRLASLGNLSPEVAREVARGEGRGRSSTDFNMAFNGGPYTASNLSSDMRSYVDASRGISPAHVAQVGNYLTSLGMQANQYAGYFTGSSEVIRNAIRDHVEKGAKITDAHITNPGDVKAVLGAIKAGKMKPEDAPPSVRAIIDDMKKKGIDPSTADPKALDQYFKDNPKALEQFKKLDGADQKDSKNLTPDQKKAKINDQEPAVAKLKPTTTATPAKKAPTPSTTF